jgi:outer membrane protein assembly factor BamB
LLRTAHQMTDRDEEARATEQLQTNPALRQRIDPVGGGSTGATRRGVLASLAGAISLLGFSGTAVSKTPTASRQASGPRGREGTPWPTEADPRWHGAENADPASRHCPPETLGETWQSPALEDGVSLLRLRADASDEKPVYAYGSSLLSPTGYVHALDPETGERSSGEWPVETDGIPLVRSAEGEPLFVAEAQQAGPGAKLRALNPETGAEQWSRSLPPAGLIPLIVYDRDRELLLSITDGPTVTGIDTSDGSEVWSAQLGENGSALFPIPGSGVLYLLTNDVGASGVASATLWAIDTGENVADRELWSVTQDDRRMGSLTVAGDGTIVAGFVEPVQLPENSDLIAFDPADGSVRWSRSTGEEPENEVYSGLARAVDGGVYMPVVRNPGSDSPDRLLEKFDVQSGETEWTFTTSGLTTGFGLDDANTYLVTLDGDVIAVDDDPDSGDYGGQSWSQSLDGDVEDIGVTLGCGTLYTGPDATGTVYALDADDGGTLDTFSVDSGVLSQVSRGRGSIWVATTAEQTGPGTLGTENRVYRLDDDGSDPPDGPEASFTVDPASPEPGQDVTFDASGSSGDIVEYRWDVDGDGEDDATTSDPTYVHSYEDAETYDAALTVQDADGNTDSATETVVVTEPGEGPPAIPEQDNPPRDLNGDGLYRDIDGSGEFTVGDVQLFFQYRDSDVVQNNPAAFNFDDGDSAEVTVADVQALFQDFQNGVSQSDADP